MTYRLDKTKISSGSFEDSAKESLSFIESTSATERLQMLEFLRAQTYVAIYHTNTSFNYLRLTRLSIRVPHRREELF